MDADTIFFGVYAILLGGAMLFATVVTIIRVIITTLIEKFFIARKIKSNDGKVIQMRSWKKKKKEKEKEKEKEKDTNSTKPLNVQIKGK